MTEPHEQLDANAPPPPGEEASTRMKGWNWHRISLGGFGLALATYLVVIPVVGLILERVTPQKTSYVIEDMSLAEQLRLRSTEAITALVFGYAGAAIGSFLNVVAYRAPRGESVVFRRSSCPDCDTQIKGRDNVPILGWLLLRGRCRSCGVAIPPRYVIVEAVAAAIFLLLYFVELLPGGANLPVRRPNAHTGVVWIIFYTKWDVIGLYAFHCLACSWLLTWVLTDIDRQRIPAWLRWSACSVLGVLPVVWPDLLPVPWLRSSAWAALLPEWLSSWAAPTVIAGGLIGALVGWLVAKVIHNRRLPDRNTPPPEHPPGPRGGHTTSAGLIVGLSLGWQAALGVWLITLVLRPALIFVARRWNRGDPPTTLVLLVSYLIQLSVWRWTYTAWWPSGATSLAAWIGVAVAFVLLCLVNRAVCNAGRLAPESIAQARTNSPAATTTAE